MKKSLLGIIAVGFCWSAQAQQAAESWSGMTNSDADSIINSSVPDSDADSWQTVAIGHTNGDFFYMHSYPDRSYEGSLLSMDLQALQFTRDAEYFLPENKGYTAVGYFVEPTVKLRVRGIQDFNIEAGAQLLGIAGDDHQIRINPIVRIEYQAQEWLKMIGGTIYGNVNHGLYEPMYDYDRFFYNNQEDGLQILINKDWEHIRFTSDTWLNWENFLEPGEAEQEKFTIGSSNRILLGKEGHKTFQIPIDIMGTHRGGQFSALQDTCLETLFNVATGMDWAMTNHWRASALVFGFKNNSNEICTKYKSGYGLYPMLTYYDHNYGLTLGYWYGNGYIGARGNYLFMSVSKYDENFAQKERNMITGRWFYEHGIFGCEAQAYYDIDEGKTDFAFGIYLKFDHDFSLINHDL